MGGAVPVPRLEPIADVALADQRQALVGDGRSGDVAAQPLQLGSLMRACRNPAMEGKACGSAQPAIIAFLGVSIG